MLNALIHNVPQILLSMKAIDVQRRAQDHTVFVFMYYFTIWGGAQGARRRPIFTTAEL